MSKLPKTLQNLPLPIIGSPLFIISNPKLVIELDGGQHGEAAGYDERRTAALGRHGYKVLRFWNSDGEEVGACGNGSRCIRTNTWQGL